MPDWNQITGIITAVATAGLAFFGYWSFKGLKDQMNSLHKQADAMKRQADAMEANPNLFEINLMQWQSKPKLWRTNLKS